MSRIVPSGDLAYDRAVRSLSRRMGLSHAAVVEEYSEWVFSEDNRLWNEGLTTLDVPDAWNSDSVSAIYVDDAERVLFPGWYALWENGLLHTWGW